MRLDATLPRRVYRRLVEMAVVGLLPAKRANLILCGWGGMWNEYFRDAEEKMEREWQTIIWPLINDFDFSVVLELSPGGGRNTERLCRLTKQIIAVDYNQYALDQTRARLGSQHEGCAITYHRNGGADLAMVADASVSAIYCWDAAVHFDREVLSAYIGEFARVLRPGGSGFVHHSDLGERAQTNIKRNPHWRSNVSKELVANACLEHGLIVRIQQPVPWPPITDCATVFSRPAVRVQDA